MSDVLSRQDKQVVMEGQEPAAFWVALGGKVPYASDKRCVIFGLVYDFFMGYNPIYCAQKLL